MRYLGRIWRKAHTGRSRRRAFTFIELVVAVALTVVLLRGMYTIFHTATNLTLLSEEKMRVMLEVSALFDYLARDLARSPFSSDNYYLNISGDRQTIKFQAVRVDRITDKFVHIQYSLTTDGIERQVFGDDPATPATLGNDGESGTKIVICPKYDPPDVTKGISSFQASYFDNSKGSIAHGEAWDLTDPLEAPDPFDPAVDPETYRTRAVKVEVTWKEENGLADQTFTLIFPIMYQ